MEESREKNVHPDFTPDKWGWIYCRTHTLFTQELLNHPLISPNTIPLYQKIPPSPRSCRTCGHYDKDNCFFTAASIVEIEDLCYHGKNRCDFCGNKLIYPFLLLQKIYNERIHGEIDFLACKECRSSVLKDIFPKQIRKRIALYGCVFLIGAIVIGYYLLLLFGLIEFGGAPIILSLILLGYLLYRYLNKILTLMKGLKIFQVCKANPGRINILTDRD